MTTNELLKFIERWAAQFDARISELIEALDTRVQGMQRELVRRFMEVVADMFEFEDGRLKRTPANIRALKKLERLFDGFVGNVARPQLRLFADELQEVASLTSGYFLATNPAATEERARKALAMAREVIGISESGEIIEGGYIARLAMHQQVRDSIREFVVRSIVSRQSLSVFQRGFRALVEGGNGIDGALQRYWRQYTYDTYNRIHEVVNESMADSLEMQYFIYQGSIIPKSRAFCVKKAGLVFSRKEAEEWRNDPDLLDKKTKMQYIPLVDRGRWNCRHFLTYISDDLAFELRPELKK